jgi:hypothetical protein
MLEETGLTRVQAETHMEILSDITGGDLASKEDLKNTEISLRKDMKNMEASIRKDMEHMGLSLKKDMEQLESTLILKLGALMTVLFGIAFAAAGLILNYSLNP